MPANLRCAAPIREAFPAPTGPGPPGPGKKGKGGKDWTPGRRRAHCTMSMATRNVIRDVVRKYMAQTADGTFIEFETPGFWRQGYEKAWRSALKEATKHGDSSEDVKKVIRKMVTNNNFEMNQKKVSADEMAKRKEHAATWITAYSPYCKVKTAPGH